MKDRDLWIWHSDCHYEAALFFRANPGLSSARYGTEKEAAARNAVTWGCNPANSYPICRVLICTDDLQNRVNTFKVYTITWIASWAAVSFSAPCCVRKALWKIMWKNTGAYDIGVICLYMHKIEVSPACFFVNHCKCRWFISMWIIFVCVHRWEEGRLLSFSHELKVHFVIHSLIPPFFSLKFWCFYISRSL